jgi:hypothetical protein
MNPKVYALTFNWGSKKGPLSILGDFNDNKFLFPTKSYIFV